MNLKKFTHNFFHDKEGRIVIAQFPNPPLIVATIFYIISHLNIPYLSHYSGLAFQISILYWAYLEIRYPANHWRRLLGLFVAITTIYPLLS